MRGAPARCSTWNIDPSCLWVRRALGPHWHQGLGGPRRPERGAEDERVRHARLQSAISSRVAPGLCAIAGDPGRPSAPWPKTAGARARALSAGDPGPDRWDQASPGYPLKCPTRTRRGRVLPDGGRGLLLLRLRAPPQVVSARSPVVTPSDGSTWNIRGDPLSATPMSLSARPRRTRMPSVLRGPQACERRELTRNAP